MGTTFTEEYTYEFRREIADEAYFRTTDGYENLAKRRGIPNELVWQWVEEFHPKGPQPNDVIHCWAGSFEGTEEAFFAYLGHDEGVDSAMLADMGETGEFDYDLLFAEFFTEPQPIADVLADATFSTVSAESAALAQAKALGMSRVNAVICYGDPMMKVPLGMSFRGLHYLGVYPDRPPKKSS